MNFTQALARFMLMTSFIVTVCLVTVGVLLISFPQAFLTVILYLAGVVFLLMGVYVLLGLLFAVLRAKLCEKRNKGGVKDV